jgi:hypothetical protein
MQAPTPNGTLLAAGGIPDDISEAFICETYLCKS